MDNLRKKIKDTIIKNDIVHPDKGGEIRIVNIKKLSNDIYNLIKDKK